MVQDRTIPPSTPDTTRVSVTGDSVSITVGQTAEIYCPISGIDTPTTMWLRVVNNIPVPVADLNLPGVTERLDSTPEGDVLVLVFDSFESAQAATYICQTTNIAGDDSSSIQVIREFGELRCN